MASLRLLATSGILQRKEPLWVLAKDACNCSSSSDKFTCREGGREGGEDGFGMVYVLCNIPPLKCNVQVLVSAHKP